MFKRRLFMAVLVLGIATFFGLCASSGTQPTESPATPAQDSWQKEFKEVCSKTQDAMTLSQEELTDLIRRCGALQPQIERLDESQKKVYLGRLRMCRGLYAYVLDEKKNEKK